MNNKIIIWLCLFPGIATAQVDTLQKKVKYYNSFVSGIMVGSTDDADEKEFSASFTTIHGVKFNSGLKVGVGVGLDTYYSLKVFPIQLSLTLDQHAAKRGLFFQLNSGYSFARFTREPEYGEIDAYGKGGFTINPMVGYQMTFENTRIYLQGGYKYQEADIIYNYPDWWGVPESSKHYELNRFVVQLGFGFE